MNFLTIRQYPLRFFIFKDLTLPVQRFGLSRNSLDAGQNTATPVNGYETQSKRLRIIYSPASLRSWDNPYNFRLQDSSTSNLHCTAFMKFGSHYSTNASNFTSFVFSESHCNLGEVFGGRPGASGVEVPAAGLYLGAGGSG